MKTIKIMQCVEIITVHSETRKKHVYTGGMYSYHWTLNNLMLHYYGSSSGYNVGKYASRPNILRRCFAIWSLDVLCVCACVRVGNAALWRDTTCKKKLEPSLPSAATFFQACFSHSLLNPAEGKVLIRPEERMIRLPFMWSLPAK